MGAKFDLKEVEEKYLSARKAKNGKNILTPIARMSFPHLYEGQPKNRKDPNSPKMFQLSLLIPPSCDISVLKKMCGEAAIAKFGDAVAELKEKGKLKTPFLDAGDHKYEGYIKGWTLLRLSCKSKPAVYKAEKGALIQLKEEDAEEVYPGRWCYASVNAFAYDQSGNKGVSFGLNNVMLMNHDESLGGRMRGEDEFDDVPDYAGPATTAKSADDLF